MKPFVLWFTGLSGAGKTTLALGVERELKRLNLRCCALDGDDLRTTLNSDLGFNERDRSENVRRVAQVAKLFHTAELNPIVALISPLRKQRDAARALFQEGEFIEIFVDAPLDVCEARDPKGLYHKARQNQITNFTGIDAVYEPPLNPELHLKTHQTTPQHLTDCILSYLRTHDMLTST